jgi:hypothetical protein
MEEYDRYRQEKLPAKLPVIDHVDWRRRMGDCIYSYSPTMEPKIRQGVHSEENQQRDLGGKRALLSNHFYYFGEEDVPIPSFLFPLIKKGQGHKKIEDSRLVEAFERWIAPFPTNIIAGDPQLKHEFDGPVNAQKLSSCGYCHLNEDSDEDEERVC